MPRLACRSCGARHRLFDREQRKRRRLKLPARRKTKYSITSLVSSKLGALMFSTCVLLPIYFFAYKSHILPVGPLSSLGTIPDKYDVAIFTACGALHNMVVDTVAQGQACILASSPLENGYEFIANNERAISYGPHAPRVVKAVIEARDSTECRQRPRQKYRSVR